MKDQLSSLKTVLLNALCDTGISMLTVAKNRPSNAKKKKGKGKGC